MFSLAPRVVTATGRRLRASLPTDGFEAGTTCGDNRLHMRQRTEERQAGGDANDIAFHGTNLLVLAPTE